jgi:hypothetical protein
VQLPPVRIIRRPLALEPEPAVGIEAKLPADLARHLVTARNPVYGELTQPQVALDQAPAPQRGRGELAREPLQDLDRLAGEQLFEQFEVVVRRVHRRR